MAITYQFVLAVDIVPEHVLRTNEDSTVTWIPTDPANSDYQAYLAYVANGNQTAQ
jgi:hypothetical protein